MSSTEYLCTHSQLALLETSADGRKQWICACGRGVSSLPDVERETVIDYMRLNDFFIDYAAMMRRQAER